jgi:septal ring factor EnvC (AmiA/AmiB activator)
VFERFEITRARGLWECASGLVHLQALKALARLITVCVPLTVASLAEPVQALSETEPAAAAPESPKPEAADRSSSQPAKLAPESSEPTHFFSRTASKQWVDRLSQARRRVLSANHGVDAANAAYARALYEKMPEGAQLQALVSRRRSANSELARALDAVPNLVERARRDGVSPEILELYENSMPR